MPSEAPPAYRPLSRQRKLFFNVAQLWVASDHLLVVSSIFGVESYRRFYFHEIQALVIRPTKGRQNWIILMSIGLAIFGGAAGVLAYFARRDTSGDAFAFTILFSIFAAFFLLGLLIQYPLGPKCQVFLQVRTGLEKLSYFNRLKLALRLRDRLAEVLAEHHPPAAPATP